MSPRVLAKPARSRKAKARPVAAETPVAVPELPEAAEWRSFVGRWVESSGCQVGEAARGDWEVVLEAPRDRDGTVAGVRGVYRSPQEQVGRCAELVPLVMPRKQEDCARSGQVPLAGRRLD